MPFRHGAPGAVFAAVLVAGSAASLCAAASESSDELVRQARAHEALNEDDYDYDSVEASLIRVTRRDYEKAVRVPPSLTGDMRHASAMALSAWGPAKDKSDFAALLPHLERNLELRHRYGTDGLEQTVQMLSAVRQTPPSAQDQTITPSAQSRLDRQFAGPTTPTAATVGLVPAPKGTG